MTVPTPCTRELLARAKMVDGPPHGSEVRIYRSLTGAAVAPSVTLGVKATEASLAAASATGRGFSVLTTGKLGLLASVTVGVVSGTLVLAGVEHFVPRSAPTQATARARAVPRPSPRLATHVAPPADSAAGSRPLPSAVFAEKAGTPAIAANPVSIAEETRLLAQVQQALRERAGQRALGLLERYRREFAKGALGEEALAAEVFALCLVGDRSGAARAGTRFRQQFAGSPLEPRVEMSCANGATADE